jgi:hypothetical protein
LDDAVNDKLHPPTTEWPNETYREFMEIVTEYQLSNLCGDRLIKLFNFIKNVNNNLFPKTTKEGRKFLDNSDFSYMKFKKVSITNFQDVDYHFYYQPIINGIKTLFLQPDINEEFVFRYKGNASIKTYDEQYKSNWWCMTKKRFQLIIIYCRLLSMLMQPREHPIYISLGNIPNWLRNKPHAKVLVGYLPKLKAKDNTTRNSKLF